MQVSLPRKLFTVLDSKLQGLRPVPCRHLVISYSFQLLKKNSFLGQLECFTHVLSFNLYTTYILLYILTQWIWVWANSRSWWRTGRTGVLQSVGSQRVGNNWASQLAYYFSVRISISPFFGIFLPFTHTHQWTFVECQATPWALWI